MLVDLMERGGWVMTPLFFCSVIALTIVAERFLFWIKLNRMRDPKGVTHILDLVRQGKIEVALQAGELLEDPVGRVLLKGLEQLPKPISSALELQAQEELRGMRRYLGILETLITLAPLLGIYGTITGIIRSFGFLSASGVPDPQLVASGIAEALITTATGLTIAILTIPPYNFFSSKTEEMVHDLERQSTHLEGMLRQ